MKKTIILCLFSCLIPLAAFAQINESDTLQLQIKGSLSGNYQKGNVELLLLRSKLEFGFKALQHFVFKSQNNHLYQAFYSRKADNDLFSRNYLYYQPMKRLYPYGIAYVSGNFRRKIDSRYFAGVGITYQLVRNNNHIIKVSGNVVYESTNFKQSSFNFPEYDGHAAIDLWRATAYISGTHHLLARKLNLVYDAFWQPGFEAANNYRTQLNIGLDFRIWKGLAFQVLYLYTHENVSVVGVKPDDSMVSFGLSYFYAKK